MIIPRAKKEIIGGSFVIASQIRVKTDAESGFALMLISEMTPYLLPVCAE